MTTAAPSTALAAIQPAFTNPERLALAGFLAGYRGLTREAYAPDLRQIRHLVPSPLPDPVRRPPCRHRKLRPGARSQGSRPVDRDPAAVRHRRVRYAVEEELLEQSPAAHSAARGWTTSRTPSRWTATGSAPCWSPPGSGRRPITR
jgi:integrase/recombinase XerD